MIAQNAKCPTESAEQIALFQWASLMAGQIPELQLMMHIPNGGARDVVTGARLKREGVKAGFPDIFLPVARGKYHGLLIEMKRCNGGTFGVAQKEWKRKLEEQGYCHCVCFGADVAREKITMYLQNGEIL